VFAFLSFTTIAKSCMNALAVFLSGASATTLALNEYLFNLTVFFVLMTVQRVVDCVHAPLLFAQ
jgi:hypothetical protein